MVKYISTNDTLVEITANRKEGLANMEVHFSQLQQEITEVCPTCGKVSRIAPNGSRRPVPWSNEFSTILLACKHKSANTYDEDGYKYPYKIEFVNEQESGQ